MKFDSLESLSLQMHEDAEFARRYAKIILDMNIKLDEKNIQFSFKITYL